MKFDPQKHHRRSIRLKGFDYSQAGAYFVTIVAWQRECLFGEIVDGEMRLNNAGKIVQWEWSDLPRRFTYVVLGAFMVMPNHFHGILFFRTIVGAPRHGLAEVAESMEPLPIDTSDGLDGSPLQHGPKRASLGAIIAQFKSRVTKRLLKIPEYNKTPIWQRNYYEHIIRNDREMDNIWRYIESNPSVWAEDDENPSHILR